MSEQIEVPSPPSKHDIQNLQSSAESLLETVSHYRGVAQSIDDRFREKNENQRISLDDLPYGEELLRTQDLPESLDQAINNLEKLADGKTPTNEAIQLYQQTLASIEHAEKTLDDCTKLPPEDEDEDGDI